MNADSDLNPTRVLVCGDWHGNLAHMKAAVRAAEVHGCQVLVQVGDLGILWPGEHPKSFDLPLVEEVEKRGIVCRQDFTCCGNCGVAEIGAELLYQVISDRAEKAALIVTTNLPFSEWTQVFPNPRLCKAVLDRVTDRAHIIETGTESHRFKRTMKRKEPRRR